MTMQSVLRRLIGGGEAAAEPAAGRAAGLAVARAAQETIGLPLAMREVACEAQDIGALLAGLDPQALLIAITRDAAVVGLAAVETQLRCAAVEVQTLGAPRPARAADRPVTETEAAMVVPLLQGVLDRLAGLGEGALPEVAGTRAGARLGDARGAGLALPGGRFDILRFEVEIGPGSDRGGRLLLALPVRSDERPAAPAAGWSDALRDTVLQAPAELEAVLHRMRLPAHRIEGLAPGDLLMLPGVDLSAVRLEDRRGRCVASVRLGQRAGLRAVRLGPPEAAPELLPEIPPRLPE